MRYSEAMPGRALIVGAGIGGLTAAIALRRAGFDVVVFERRADPRMIEFGGGMVLWTNATRALSKLDLLERVKHEGVPLERFEWRTPKDSRIASWPVGDMGREYGAPTVGIRRMRLQSVLVDAAGEETLRLGAEVTRFEQDDEGVTVLLSDGTEERGDVLIGADGINSTVRSQHLGGWTKPQYAGYNLWFGIAAVPTAAQDPVFRETGGAGRRFIHFPVADGEVYWSAIANAPEGRFEAGQGEQRDKDLLLSGYDGWAEPTARLIAGTDPDSIYRREIADRDPIDSWGEGRYTLLGDAAHAMTINLGQGACQAIEDGVVLAGKLGRATDVVSALRAYEQERMKRTAWFVRRSRQIGDMGRWTNPLACLVRNQLQRVVFNTVALSAQRRNLSYEFP